MVLRTGHPHWHVLNVLSKNCFMVLRTGHPHWHVLNVLSKNCLKWCFMVLVIPCHGNPTMMKIDQNGENYRKCSLDICSVYLHFFYVFSIAPKLDMFSSSQRTKNGWCGLYPLVNVYSLLSKMVIDILWVFPSKNGGSLSIVFWSW